MAYWFYLDLIRPEDPSLPACNMKEFMATGILTLHRERDHRRMGHVEGGRKEEKKGERERTWGAMLLFGV